MHLCFNKIFRLLLIVMLHAQKYRGDSTEYSSAVGNAIKCKCALKTMWTSVADNLPKPECQYSARYFGRFDTRLRV